MDAADYFAIQNLLNRYFRYVDTGNLGQCGQLFAHADLTYTQSGKTFSKDPNGLTRHMESFVRLYDDGTPKTRHHSGNIIIEPKGKRAAEASCSAIIYQGTESLPFQAIGSASYRDKLEKQDDDWIFTAREMRLDFIGDLRHHLLKEYSHN